MGSRAGAKISHNLLRHCWNSPATNFSSSFHSHAAGTSFLPRKSSSWMKKVAAVTAGSILGTATIFRMEAQMDSSTQGSEKIALDNNKWVQFKLKEVSQVSHNTNLYRFQFDPDAKLGLYVASCVVTRAPEGTDQEGKLKYVIRPYTPISDPEAKGFFDLLVKIYPEGKMTQHFARLKPGDMLDVKGPIPTLEYRPNMKKHIGMIAGGTGITPMLQIIDAVLKNPEDKTKITLLYCNISPDDILLKEKLDALSCGHPNFKVYYLVDKPSHGWIGGVGYISKDTILKGLPGPSEDALILVCGPPGMMKHASGTKNPDRSQGEVSGLLKELGYSKDMVHKF